MSARRDGRASAAANVSVPWLCLLLTLLSGFLAGSARAESPLPVPPPMPVRAIAPGDEAPAGRQVVLNDRGANFTLFVPQGYAPAASGEVTLTVHFHTAVWFGIQEHLRRGCANPIVCFHAGEGSAVYRAPFEDRERFGRWLRLVEAELVSGGAPTNTRVTAIEISSFSAGYGAVRELVRQPEYRRLLRRVVLSDSLYGGLDAAALAEGRRVVLPEHVDCWLPLAREAMAGEKDFVLTVSAIPTARYASSTECADAILAALGVPKRAVAPGSLPSADDPDFPLRHRADQGRFHVWYYDGTNAPAHLTHPRHLADVWRALDARAPR